MNFPHIKRISLCLLCFLLFASVAAGASKNEKVDHIALAALLIKDGHFKRADAALNNVDTEDKGTDTSKFFTLRGLVNLQLGKRRAAIAAFNLAIDEGQDNPVIHVYLAQAYYQEKQYQQTIAALDAANDAGKSDPQLFLIRSQAHWQLEQKELSWQALTTGLEQFPEATGLLRRQVFMLVELELYQAAVELGNSYLQQADPTVEDYLAIGRALRKSRQLEDALIFYEAALLRFPENRDVLLETSHAYLELDMTQVAAQLLERAAVYDPTLTIESAEIHRRDKNHLRALYFNSQVSEQKEKIKQRLAILVDLEEYSQVAAMRDSVYRVQLLEDDNVAYAMAYAHFKIGQYNEAEDYLRSIHSAAVFDKGTQLRKAMTDCRQHKWLCY